ncbi:hypothetical protein GCM10010182_70910 [Actinomadura cremea]|nr:hypothetical protein GCM10010182_70910 [Actinomadura cremea]
MVPPVTVAVIDVQDVVLAGIRTWISEDPLRRVKIVYSATHLDAAGGEEACGAALGRSTPARSAPNDVTRMLSRGRPSDSAERCHRALRREGPGCRGTGTPVRPDPAGRGAIVGAVRFGAVAVMREMQVCDS